MRTTRPILTILTLLVCALFPSEAFSAGGGGGGGGNIGGASGPDPNKAYKEGVDLLLTNDCRKAARKFRAVLKIVPRNAQAHYLRGRSLACDEKLKAAVSAYKKAIKYDRDLYAAYQYLGLTLVAMEELDEATEQLETLAEFRSACSDACPSALDQAHAALSEAIDGRKTNADHSLLFEAEPERRSVYRGAIELINTRKFEQAIDDLEALLLAIGPEADVLNYLGYAHRNLRRFEESLAYYEQALALDPDHRGAHEYLGELFVELGQIEKARDQLQTLDRICPFGCAEFEDLNRRIESSIVAAR